MEACQNPPTDIWLGIRFKTGTEMKQTTTSEFKYWLRIHGIQLKWLGTGTKNNPIKIKSKKRNK